MANGGVLKLAMVLPLLVIQHVQGSLKCEIDGSLVRETVFGSVDFEFWYAVGMSGSSKLDDLRIFELEQLLYTSIDEEVLWCTTTAEWDASIMSTEEGLPEDSTEGSPSGEGGLRKRALQETNSTNKTVLGPVLFTPGRKDEVTEYECPEGLQDRADQCVVMKGMMSILAHDVDRIESAIWGMRKSIRTSIESSLWQRQQVENIEFLVYLGDNEDEAFRGGGAGGGFAFVTKSTNEEDDDDDGGGLWLLLVPLLLLLLILLLGMFTYNNVLRKKLPEKKERAIEPALVGTGDHPESYHRGSYHYSPEGQQYLSTICEKCLATRREYFYYLNCAEKAGLDGRLGHGVFLANRLALDSPKDELMGTIEENEPYNTLPVHPSMRTGLAQRHWGNDVHNCGSALCQRCAEHKGTPIFIKAKNRTPIDPEATQQLESVWVDPNLRTSPEHGEV